jgi:CRP-like cAMP-binding protein
MMNFPIKRTQDCKNCDSRKSNVFCELPDSALELLDKSKVLNHFKKGQYIFYSGNYPSGLYCVNSGVIKLESSGSTGNTHILRVVQGGGILGYRSLFADEAYEATAVVHEDAVVCHIPKSAIGELLKKYPDVGLKFLSHVSKELKSAENRICGLTDKNAAERIAEAVLFLKDNFKDQNWTRKEIAEWAGTTPETVMRSLADFEAEGIVELKGRKINILKKDILMERANLAF